MNATLENKPAVPVWLFFGLSGAGKNWAANTVAKALGWRVYDADDDITDAMRQALAEARPFTDAMRDDFFARLPARIAQHRQAGTTPLLVTQAVYKQRHRELLQQHVPGLIPVWIDAPEQEITRRLQHRNAGISLASARALLADFEVPPPGTLTLVNDSNADALLRRFSAMIDS